MSNESLENNSISGADNHPVSSEDLLESVIPNEPTTEGWWFVCDFSEDELLVLRTSFGAVKNRLENVAVSAFMSLFDYRPDAFAVFVGKKVLPDNRGDVAYSWETKQHGLRVLSVVERCLNRIDKWDMVRDIITSLAVRHLSYGAKPVYILSLFGCLRAALLKEMKLTKVSSHSDITNLQPQLGETSINTVWNKFFRVLGLSLVAEMLSLQETMPEKSVAATPPEDPNKLFQRTSLPNGTSQPQQLQVAKKNIFKTMSMKLSSKGQSQNSSQQKN